MTCIRMLGPFAIAGLMILAVVGSAFGQTRPVNGSGKSQLIHLAPQPSSTGDRAETVLRTTGKFVSVDMDRSQAERRSQARPEKSGTGLRSTASDASATFGKRFVREAPSARKGRQSNAQDVSPGSSFPVWFPAVAVPTLFHGDYALRFEVPSGANSVSVRLETRTRGADVDLFVRRGVEPDLQGGQVVSDYRSENPDGNELVTMSPASSPALRSGTHFAAFAVFTPNLDIDATVTVTVDGGTSSGRELRFDLNLPAVDSPTFFHGEWGHRITVPAGVTSARFVLSTQTRDADVDLFVRRGADPELHDGQIVADYAAEGLTGEEEIYLNPVAPGEYFVAYALYTPGVDVRASLAVTLEGVAVDPPTRVLTSGTPSSWQLPAVDNGTLFTGDFGFRIIVPEGASRLTIRLNTATPNADVDLYARYGQDVDIDQDGLVADHFSEGPSGDEAIEVTAGGGGTLRAGVYYIAFGVFTPGVPVAGTVTATIETNPVVGPPSQDLRSGVPAQFELPPVDGPTLFHGDYSFRIAVPSHATRLEIRLNTLTPDTDVDLFARYGRDTELADGRLVTDHGSESLTGEELIVISGSSLRAGDYWISMAVFTPGRTVRGTVTATVTTR